MAQEALTHSCLGSHKIKDLLWEQAKTMGLLDLQDTGGQ